ncbi:MAG: 4-hydroxy-3-methylbut-2-enyl diphosphate reductase (EC, partial [uncultured Thiotrichaceae bacterium]
QLATKSDLILVVGSPNSSNSNRLRELAEKRNTPAYLIDDANDIQPEWLENVNTVGLTAGASAPEILVQGVIEHLRKHGATVEVQNSGITENISFVLPKELR